MCSTGEEFPKISSSFQPAIVKELIKSSSTNTKKISDEAVELISELAKVMVIEAALRADKNCYNVINLENVEVILPQIITLDTFETWPADGFHVRKLKTKGFAAHYPISKREEIEA